MTYSLRVTAIDQRSTPVFNESKMRMHGLQQHTAHDTMYNTYTQTDRQSNSRRHLCSARRHYLVVPRHSLSSYGRRTFAVDGLTACDSLSCVIIVTVSDVLVHTTH